MSKENDDMKNELGKFAGRYAPRTIVPATVTAVNGDTTIGVEFSDGTPIPDCRLKSVIKDGNQVLLIPVVGSSVLVGSIENSSDYVVIAVAEISEVQQIIDGVTYSMSTDGFLIKKGDDTLHDALSLIIEAVMQVVVIYGNNPDYAKLQQALAKVQNILR